MAKHKDWREKNPRLHMFYVKQAVEHLTVMKRMLKEL